MTVHSAKLDDLERHAIRCLFDLREQAKNAGAHFELRAFVEIGGQSVEIGMRSGRAVGEGEKR